MRRLALLGAMGVCALVASAAPAASAPDTKQMRWIFRYHPKAQPTGTGAWWSLLERVPVWGDGTGYTALGAKVNHGSVSAFSVWYQAGGD